MKFNWRDLDFRKGFRYAVAAIIAFFVGSAIGLPGVITSVSTIIISLSDFNGPLRERLKSMCFFTILGALLTLAAGIFGQSMWPMGLSTLVISFICGLALVFGSRIAHFAMLLNVWYLIAQPFGSSQLMIISPLCVIVGGVIVTAEILVVTALRGGGHSPDLDPRDPRELNPDLHGLFSLDSPIFRFSLIKGCSIGFSALAGWMLIGAHPFWVTYSPITIIKPDLQQTVSTSIQRIAGTIIGGIAGLAVTGIVRSEVLLLILFFVGVFFMVAVFSYNYTLFITILTAVLMMIIQMAGAPFGIPEIQRIAATVLGIAVTFVVIIILHFFMHTIREKPERSG